MIYKHSDYSVNKELCQLYLYFCRRPGTQRHKIKRCMQFFLYPCCQLIKLPPNNSVTSNINISCLCRFLNNTSEEDHTGSSITSCQRNYFFYLRLGNWHFKSPKPPLNFI